MKLKDVRWLGFGFALVMGGAFLHAQPAEDPIGSGKKAINSAKLTLVEMVARIGDQEKVIKNDLRHGRHLQDVARKAKDVIKLTCVNDKLIQMKAEANIFDMYRNDLSGLSEESTNRTTVFDKASESATLVHKLRTEADGCIGEAEISTDSANSADHPPFPDDPTKGQPFDNGLEPPAYASPYN